MRRFASTILIAAAASAALPATSPAAGGLAGLWVGRVSASTSAAGSARISYRITSAKPGRAGRSSLVFGNVTCHHALVLLGRSGGAYTFRENRPTAQCPAAKTIVVRVSGNTLGVRVQYAGGKPTRFTMKRH